VRRHRNRSSRHIPTKIAIALFSIVSSVVALGLILSPVHPRTVTVAETASISPLPTTIGFADADIYGQTPANVTRTMGLMAVTGVKTVRLMIPWVFVEPVPGQFYWSDVDKTVNAALAQNMSILAFISATPTWAVAVGALPISGRPASSAAYGDFAAQVASRYKGKIAAYEIWNEPNGSMFFSPSPDPAAYTDLLKAAYPKIKAIDPAVPVISAGLGAVTDYGTVTMNPVTFVTKM
jgi:GH35 family endo-1,4-beta-xylanase